MGDYITVRGVKIDTDFIKEYGKDFVELKNGVKINIWSHLDRDKKEGYITLGENNKTIIGNLLIDGLTGSDNADDIELYNVRFMGHADLRGGDDKLYIKESATRDVDGGDGNDKFIFEKTRTIGNVKGEDIIYKNYARSHGTVEAETVLFTDGSGAGFEDVKAKNVTYKNQFMRRVK